MSSISPPIATTAAWGIKPTAREVQILSFREQRNPAGTVLGYLDLEMPSGMRLFGCN